MVGVAIDAVGLEGKKVSGAKVFDLGAKGGGEWFGLGFELAVGEVEDLVVPYSKGSE